MKLTLEFFVATALWAVNESIEMPFFRGLDDLIARAREEHAAAYGCYLLTRRTFSIGL